MPQWLHFLEYYVFLATDIFVTNFGFNHQRYLTKRFGMPSSDNKVLAFSEIELDGGVHAYAHT